ncbi:hypothetical protein GALL_507850 [mine drainage metagenome]|uniref:Uncharacterized protein n=1 Tax=mine drainage metagenome TaxID=410659 RepID=A0A1J5PJC1_9ZZZZ
MGIEILNADVEDAALEPQFEEFRAGNARGNIRARKAVDLKITVVEENDPPLLIGYHHALVEVVQGGTDERIPAQFRTFDLAQRRQYPQPDRDEETADDDAAKQHFPWIDRAEIDGEPGFGNFCPGDIERRDDGEKAQHDARGNHDPAARLPILVCHQSPADFCGGVSGLTRLDQVNAYPHHPKMRAELRQLP